MFSFLKWAGIVLGAVLAYEGLRYLLFRRLRSAFRRSVQGFLERHQVQIAKFQFANKLLVRQTLLNDPDIHQGMLAHAAAGGRPLQEAREAVENYIEEIVPSFNLVSYYKIGYPLARLFVHSLYSPVVDRDEAEQARRIPPDASVVYVLNHRSNMDFILASYVLSEQVALSYAVGEWARVWPLEELFKSFGSYFVRRNYREPLYHLVLEKYVQLLTRKAGKQAIFIEGGLSRDGRFREPKIGLLDYIIKVKRDPSFTRDFVFVPAGINYDRVLEDTYLLREKLGKAPPRGFLEKTASLFRVLWQLARTVILNVYRYLTGAVLRHGYACVCFGAPVSLDEYLSARGIVLGALDDEGRKQAVKGFAVHLMEKIGEVLPVTPVSLVAGAFLESGAERLPKIDLTRRVRKLRDRLIARGAHVVAGKEFERAARAREAHEDEKPLYNEEIFDVVSEMFASDVAQQTVDVAMDVLRRRALLVETETEFALGPGAREILEYYANSIAHLTGEAR